MSTNVIHPSQEPGTGGFRCVTGFEGNHGLCALCFRAKWWGSI